MTNQGRNDIDAVLAQGFKELALTQPIEKITIKEITDKAGVIRPTFYNHFQDKYELLEWIVQKDLMEPVAPFFDNGMLREGITFILTSIERDKEFYRNAARMEGQNSFGKTLVKCLTAELERHMDFDSVRGDLSFDWITPEMLSAYYANSLCYLFLHWIESDMSIAIPEMADLFMIIFQRSLVDVLRTMHS